MSLIESFVHNRKGKTWVPLDVLDMGQFRMAIYQGDITEFDIVIKYRQKIGENWSLIRTPKHIHWTVDVLTKMFADGVQTREFIDFLIKMWEETIPITEDAKGLN